MTTRPRPAPSNDRNAPSQERAAYLVLGMHRSGTSAMASVLALAGAEMPEDLMPGDEHNAKGYFEPWKIAMLNGERLRAGQSAWDDPFSFPYQPLDAQAETDWIDRACDLLKSEYGRANFPLIKDPRVSVLMPLWRTALEQMGMPIRVVIPIRHPLEVAGSLTRRDRFPVEKSVLLWCSYMLASEIYSRGLPRAFVAYDSLLKDWRGAVSQIEAAHGKALPRLNDRASRAIDDFLTSDLRHNQSQLALDDLPLVGGLAAKLHSALMRAAGGDRLDDQAIEDARQELAEMQARFGMLVSPVTHALDAARTDLLHERQHRAHEQGQAKAQGRELVGVQAELAQIEASLNAVWAAR